MKKIFIPNEFSIVVNQIKKSPKNLHVITSSVDGEGKTLFCLLIALSYKDLFNHKVMVLDLNRRHPKSLADLKNEYVFDESHFDYWTPPEGFDSFEFDKKIQCIESVIREGNEEQIFVIDTSPVNIFNRNNVHPAQLQSLDPEYHLIISREISNRSEVLKSKDLFNSQGLAFTNAFYNEYEAEKRTNENPWKAAVETISQRLLAWMKI